MKKATIFTNSWGKHPIFMSMTVLFIVLLALSSCGKQQQGGTGQPDTVQGENGSATNTPRGAFNTLHMLSASIGWAETMNSSPTTIYFTVLRTTDGGVHWKAVLKCSPYQGSGKGAGFATCPADFRSATLATVLETQKSSITIYHTTDGGQTWQRSTLNAGYIGTPPIFVDAQHGWALVTDNFPGYDPGSQYIGKEIALFRTVDGGQSWQKIGSSAAKSQLPSTSDDAYGSPPFEAATRMEFISATTGWLAGTTYRSENSMYSWMYVTHDGGTSWHQVSISFPASADVLQAPQFFDVQDGLMPVLTSSPAPAYTSQTMLYVTHDAGATWTETFVPFDVTSADYVDTARAWAWTGSLNLYTFSTTSDGWRHWTKENLHTSFANINGFDFISPALGWAIANNVKVRLPEPGGGLRSGDIVALLKTTDGGKTWQEIAHSVVE